MRNNRVAEMKPIEEYALDIAATVASKGIKIKLGATNDKDMYSIVLSAVSDGRICNKVYTMLKEAGVLESFNYTQSPPTYSHNLYHYSAPRKSPKRWHGVVSREWFEKNSQAMAKAPVFETSGLKRIKEDSWSDRTTRKLVIEKENYIPLFHYNSFSKAEYIYIYWHLNEYVIEEFSEQLPHRGLENVTKIFPRAQLSELSKGIFKGHASDYLDKHFEWVVKHVLDIPDDRVMNKVKYSNLRSPGFILENWTDFMCADHIAGQLTLINQIETMLKYGKESWLKVSAAAESLGGWAKVKEIARVKFWNYLEENFPLHIGDNETDKDLKKLCEWMMLGKDKGFNEAEQRANTTTTATGG